MGLKTMTYDGLITAAVVAEISGLLIGGKVQKIRQHSQTELTIELHAPGRTINLFFSIDSNFPRFYLTHSMPTGVDRAPNFCMALRKHIEGTFLARVVQVGFDRVVDFRFESHHQPPRRLIVELMGKHSNLILVNDENVVLGVMKVVTSSISRTRQVLPGKPFQAAPSSGKTNPIHSGVDLISRLWDDAFPTLVPRSDVIKWLVSTFEGFGPFLAEEIAAVACVAISQSQLEISESPTPVDIVSKDTVVDAIRQLVNTVISRLYNPNLIIDPAGKSLAVIPISSVRFLDDRQLPRNSFSDTLDAFYRQAIHERVLESARSALAAGIRQSATSQKNTLRSVERTLEESQRSDKYRQSGELLLANLESIDKGVNSATVADYFDPNVPEIAIELNEKLTPLENADSYFKRYRKARDAGHLATQRLEVVKSDLHDLDKARLATDSATSREELDALRENLAARGLLRVQRPPEQTAKNEFGGHRIGRVETPDGWEILYGENAQSNDYLTQRVARPGDTWLHARSITGAHVIIRSRAKSEIVPRAVLVRAAKIAALRSDAKHSSIVPVDYTLRKYVRKPRGAAPGLVTCRNEKTIDVSPKEPA